MKTLFKKRLIAIGIVAALTVSYTAVYNVPSSIAAGPYGVAGATLSLPATVTLAPIPPSSVVTQLDLQNAIDAANPSGGDVIDLGGNTVTVDGILHVRQSVTIQNGEIDLVPTAAGMTAIQIESDSVVLQGLTIDGTGNSVAGSMTENVIIRCGPNSCDNVSILFNDIIVGQTTGSDDGSGQGIGVSNPTNNATPSVNARIIGNRFSTAGNVTPTAPAMRAINVTLALGGLTLSSNYFSGIYNKPVTMDSINTADISDNIFDRCASISQGFPSPYGNAFIGIRNTKQVSPGWWYNTYSSQNSDISIANNTFISDGAATGQPQFAVSLGVAAWLSEFSGNTLTGFFVDSSHGNRVPVINVYIDDYIRQTTTTQQDMTTRSATIDGNSLALDKSYTAANLDPNMFTGIYYYVPVVITTSESSSTSSLPNINIAQTTHDHNGKVTPSPTPTMTPTPTPTTPSGPAVSTGGSLSTPMSSGLVVLILLVAAGAGIFAVRRRTALAG